MNSFEPPCTPPKESLLMSNEEVYKKDPLPDVYLSIEMEDLKQQSFLSDLFAAEEVVETSDQVSNPSSFSDLSSSPPQLPVNQDLNQPPEQLIPPPSFSYSAHLQTSDYPTDAEVPGPSVSLNNPFSFQFTNSYIPYPGQGQPSSTPYPPPPPTTYQPAPLLPPPPATSTVGPQPLPQRTPRPNQPRKSSSGKVKRNRTDFKQAQVDILEECFARNRYIREPEKSELADRLGLTSKNVTIWYQNKRARLRDEAIRNGQGVAD